MDSIVTHDPLDASSNFLTSKQQNDLHLALLDYTYHHGFRRTYEALLEETQIKHYNPSLNEDYRNLLEKKWSSIIRLQKKVLELETKLTQIQEESPSLLRPSHRMNGHSSAHQKSWTDQIPKGPELMSFPGHRMAVTRVVFHFHPAYPILASTSEDATIRIYDLESGSHEKTLRGHTQAINDICFDPSPSGNYLASCSSDLSIKLWKLDEDFNCIRTLMGHEHVVSAIRFIWMNSTKQLLLASGSRDQSVKIWDVISGSCLRQYTGHRDWVRCLDVSEDFLWVSSAGNDQSIHIWNAQTCESRSILEGHLHAIETVAFAPSSMANSIKGSSSNLFSNGFSTTAGSYLASASRDKTICLWDTQNGTCLITLQGHDNWVRYIAFHPGGTYLISVSDDQSIRVWDLRTGKSCKIIEKAHSNFITCAAFNAPYTTIAPKQLLMATGGVDQLVRIWECR